MAKDNTEQTGGTSAVEKGFGALERAWDTKWALRLLCLILFVDMSLMLHAGRGLRQWSPDDKVLSNDVGWIALSVVAFSFAMAIVIPIVLIVLRNVSVIVLGWLPAFLRTSTDQPYQWPGYVPASEFRDLALREKDSFLWRLYEAHEQEKEAMSVARERAGDLIAAALLAALADWVLTQRIPGSVGLVSAINEALGSWAPGVTAVTLLCAGAILKWTWFSEPSRDEIYYPPLAQELEKEREALRHP